MHGLEREGIRVTPDGHLSPTPHPKSLGSSLTHPYITTDFAECQLEFRTLPEPILDTSLDQLNQIQSFTAQRLENELIWPFSMPPRLPENDDDIPLAQYGDSKLAREKTIYRRGIGHRYGRRIQTVSGVHYNFSLKDSATAQVFQSVADAQSFASESDCYFHIVRNLYRRMPFLTYLFGASPAFDTSYEPTLPQGLMTHKSDTVYGEFATSIRQSGIGYTSDVQDRLRMSYDSIETFVHDFAWALDTPNPQYQQFSVENAQQLNTNYLQAEQELYAAFRPKQNMESGEKLLDALRNRGVSYIEFRALDVDPFCPGGVDPQTVAFLQLVILHCLADDSAPLSDEESNSLTAANHTVAWRGREPDLKIPIPGAESSFHESGRIFCEELQQCAEDLDRSDGSTAYRDTLKTQIEKWKSPERTPSGKHLAHLLDNDMEFLVLGLNLAENYRHHLSYLKPDTAFQKEIESGTPSQKS
jgi:glutamate--cysteine ligase